MFFFFKRLDILEMDVTDPQMVSRCFETVRQKVDSLDLIINNAGILGNQIERPINEVQSKELMEV
jgi:NADP-dependent 3-hydroxy acid dehydrogenase YdfG